MDKLKEKIISLMTGLSIQVKIYGMVLFVTVLISSMSLLVVRISMVETLSTQLDERVKSIGSDVAARSVDFFLTNNVYALQQLVSETGKHYSDIEYVFILNENNRVVVHSFGMNGVNRDLLYANEITETGMESMKKFNTEKGVIRDVAVPVVKGIGGTVRVGLREDTLIHALTKVTSQLLLTMLGTLLVAFIIVFGLTKILTFPINRLVDLTREVSKGNFGVRIKEYPDDEIGKLTEAFHNMLTSLEHTEREKDGYLLKIVSRNRELSLLNKLTGNFISFEQMKVLLQNYVIYLVKELSLNRATLTFTWDGNPEKFEYYSNHVHCDHLSNGDVVHCKNCKFNAEKCTYSFPITISERNTGVLDICSFQELDEYSVNILTSIANQLAVSLENLQLWLEVTRKEEMRQKLLEKVITAQEEERKRIARELHDETSQSLTSILLGITMLGEKKAESEREEAIKHLRNVIKHTLEEVHELAWQLRPSILDKFGLAVALERYIEEYMKKYSIDVDIFMQDVREVRLKSEVETTIYRIVQESLTNIARYSQAKNVSVIIQRNNGLLSVIIEDDGVGFDVEQVMKRDPAKHNLGLHGMDERAFLVGGTLTIESQKNQGTTIFVKIPFHEEENDLEDKSSVG
ncbi:ATP-binding protein [Brevibacillus sp. SYSU BS000544]|uniref:sensor histidine kinase n=1 Tax=Brevibacillus sp. SYSU BS000544 TaxID=3416443 RepID=UPI003CE4CC6D